MADADARVRRVRTRVRNLLVAIGLCALLAAATAAAVYYATRGPEAALPFRGEPLPERTLRPLFGGEPWIPRTGGGPDGFVEAAGNASFALYAHPDTTQIQIREKSSGYVWRSNPSAADLEDETATGFFRTNLQSPFIVEYFIEGRTQKLKTDAFHEQLEKTMIRTATGLQVTYKFIDLRMQFAIQYELTDRGLAASIPSAGIVEEGEYRITAVELLPFFGAERGGGDGDGYLFVPDGPGGLIRFAGNKVVTGKGYFQEIYGSEIADLWVGAHGEAEREDVRFPVFGLKSGEHAFLAVIREGEYTAAVRALPASIVSSYYSVNASFLYRPTFSRRLTKLGKTVEAIRPERETADRTVEYRFLSGADADYAGMARAYRSYLLETGELRAPLAPVRHVPLELWIIGGDARDAYGGSQYTAVTTFAQAGNMVDELVSRGVERMNITYLGWQKRGNQTDSKAFSLEPKLGGRRGAEAFLARMREYGFPVLFYHIPIDADKQYLRATPRSDGIRGIDGTVRMFDNRFFLLNAPSMLRTEYELIDSLKRLGAGGILYQGLGSFVYRDYHPDLPMTREDMAFVHRSILQYAGNELGTAAVMGGSAFSLGAVDAVTVLSSESNYDYAVDETVPFYPIALHGFKPYTFIHGNFRTNGTAEFLKMIEYGAMPAFALTHDSARELKGTVSDNFVSTEFANWRDRVVEEYGQSDRMAGLYHRTMEDHRRLRPGVYETTYDNGTKVIVDYNSETYEVIEREP